MTSPNFHFWAAHQDTKTKLIFICGSLLVGALLIFALTLVPRRFRKTLIATVTFIAGLYFSLEYLIPAKATAESILESKTWSDNLLRVLFGWALRPIAAANVAPEENFLSPTVQGLTAAWQVIAGFTFALGVWNLVHIHGKNIIKAKKNWIFSAFFFLGMLFMASAGFWKTYGPSGSRELGGSLFGLASEGMFFPLDAAMFSLIAFFIISAAYRAFRIRSFEAGFMMAAAFLVMLGQVPVGIWMTSWIDPAGPWHNLRLEQISYWILTQPNAAAQRAVNFGLAVGAMAMGLRIWLSLERGSYFEKEI